MSVVRGLFLEIKYVESILLKFWIIVCVKRNQTKSIYIYMLPQWAGGAEYTDCITAEA